MIAGSGTKNPVATNLSTDERRGVPFPQTAPHFSQPSTALDVRCASICALPPLERSLRRNSVGGLARSVFAGAETKQNRRIGFASAALASAGALVGGRKMRGANDAWEPLPSTSPSPSRAYRECDSSRFCFRGEGEKKSLLAHEMPPEPSYKDTPLPASIRGFAPCPPRCGRGGKMGVRLRAGRPIRAILEQEFVGAGGCSQLDGGHSKPTNGSSHHDRRKANQLLNALYARP
jgi:hypothetical protein